MSTKPTIAPLGATFNFAQHVLELNAARPDALAFIDDQGSLSYGQLAQLVCQSANALLASGLRREERVLLLMHDQRHWPVGFLGALYAGLVPVPVNTLLTADDYAHMLEHSRAQAVLVSGALLPTLRAALGQSRHEVRQVVVSQPQGPLLEGEVEFDDFLRPHSTRASPAATSPDDPAFWLYSSGSTGRPKAALHTHANPYWTAELYGKRVLGLRANDLCFSAAKLFFAYGLGNALIFPLATGATTLLMAERATPEAVFQRWIGAVGGLQPTVFYGAPTGFAAMLAHPALPSRAAVALRLVSSAGEALPAQLGERFRSHFGIDIIDGIGSTEMLHIYLSNRPDRVRYGSSGWPVPGYTIELRAEDGLSVVPEGELGDLYVQGPSAALLYWGNRDKSRDTFQGHWVKSGDKYTQHSDGSYTYGGRSDDMLKVSGIYVSPFEVESTLMQHPAVMEAAVIGVHDAEGLIKSKAYVVLKAGQHTDEAALKAFVKDKLAPYKYPRQIAFVHELPKTASGKIQRFKLRQLDSIDA
jgi:benzoate-CoA ligase